MKIYYKIRNFLKYTLFYRNHFKFAYQRVFRGYSDYDVYDFSSFLARIARDGVLKIKEKNLSYPAELSNEREWHLILTRIAKSFDLLLQSDELFYVDLEERGSDVAMLNEKKRKKEIQEGIDLLSTWFRSLWV